ncbi:lysylphosphatidylglycerol synthase transmembrane domain-containing protein [soil metagenome]
MGKILRFTVSAALICWLAWRTDWTSLGQALAQARFGLWWLAAGLYLASQGVSALRWQLLAQPLGFQRTFGEYTRMYFIGMFFNLFLPTSVGGDVMRAWQLQAGGERKLHALLSVFIDRASGLFVLLCLGVCGVLASPVELPPMVRNTVYLTGLGALLGGVGAIAATFFGQRFARVRKLSAAIHLYLANPGLAVSSTLLSLVVQGTNVAVVWILSLALNLDVPLGYFVVAVPMVSLMTVLPISLNGIGVREGGMVLFLSPLGVADATAVSLAVLWFMVFTAASLVGGVVYFLSDSSRPKEISHAAVVGDYSDQGRAGQSRTAA